MNLLSDIITYVRRLVKSPSNAVLSDDLIIDYVNRFWIMDVDARMQLFDLKTQYVFQCNPGVDQYNMPLYNVQTQPGGQNIGIFPVYQGFLDPVYVNGIQVPFYTTKDSFWNIWPNYVQSLSPADTGDGTEGPYNFQLPFFPALPGHIDMVGIIASGNNQDPPVNNNLLVSAASPYNGNSVIPTTSVYPGVTITATGIDGSTIVVTDSGQFLSGNVNFGLLMTPGQAPFGNAPLTGGYTTTSNVINYSTGEVFVTFPSPVAENANINTQCYFYEQGIPRAVLYYNNVITIRPPANIPFRVEMTAYLSPAAFLNTGAAIPFGYMAEYIARGAARKILSDTGDIEQFQFYEPLFREQEILVWKRSQRQFTSTRTPTIFSQTQGQANGNMGLGSI